MIEFIYSSPYNFFMTWLLLALINIFIMMMMERIVFRLRNYDEQITSCADWTSMEWGVVILTSVVIPLGWALIIVFSLIEFGPELIKERKWPKKEGWSRTAHSGTGRKGWTKINHVGP